MTTTTDIIIESVNNIQMSTIPAVTCLPLTLRIFIDAPIFYISSDKHNGQAIFHSTIKVTLGENRHFRTNDIIANHKRCRALFTQDFTTRIIQTCAELSLDYIEQNWEKICHDVANQTANHMISIY